MAIKNTFYALTNTAKRPHFHHRHSYLDKHNDFYDICSFFKVQLVRYSKIYYTLSRYLSATCI